MYAVITTPNEVAQASCQPPNKQLQRTVIPNRWRAASASFHYAHAARWTLGHAAAELRRYVACETSSWRSGNLR